VAQHLRPGWIRPLPGEAIEIDGNWDLELWAFFHSPQGVTVLRLSNSSEEPRFLIFDGTSLLSMKVRCSASALRFVLTSDAMIEFQGCGADTRIEAYAARALSEGEYTRWAAGSAGG
jgi:hypothetical protein